MRPLRSRESGTFSTYAPTRPQFDKIMVYCQKVSYTADWGFLLTNIVRVTPAGALQFAQKLAAAEVPMTLSQVAWRGAHLPVCPFRRRVAG